jgi:NADH:ubiquinone oxidoreductase subunit F (NADH-binding)/(2Fe-2S) ferredoxin/ferredoxin
MSRLILEDLKRIKEEHKDEMALRHGSPVVAGGYKSNLMICGGTGCIASGGSKIKEALESVLKDKGLANQYKIVFTGCNGFCAEGPIMIVWPEGIFYEKLKPEDMATIAEEHFIGGKPVEKFMYKLPGKADKIPFINDIPFFNLQVPITLRNKGLVDPELIEDYIARDGYFGLAKALLEMKPEEITDAVKHSGLRGRGGAGFPTGIKWELGLKIKSDEKYVVCNGDEGDPGAFMDRSIMESDPHAVIEGMIICGVATESHKGYIYVRAEYPLAVKRLQIAIDQCYAAGMLGKNILDSGFDFDLEIYQGAGAFVCGEATALMRSIEGKRGMPRPKLWRSAVKGLFDKPTILNNVETFANIPQILIKGSDWYKDYGTEKSTGTKVFALTGAINNVGLIEIPMDTTLNKIIFDIGGGVEKGRKFKAVQLGGPSGGCVPEELLETPVTYEDIMNTGAKFFLDFTAEESCGKCTPCRIGTNLMLDVLTDICEGRGKEGDIEILEDMSDDIIAGSLCGLGQSAPNPVLSTLKYFKHEYEMHINEQWCSTGVCRDLCTFYIDEESCKGCGACKRVCPSEAIVGEKKKLHVIDQARCIKCRSCYVRCKFGSVKAGPASLRDEILKKEELVTTGS